MLTIFELENTHEGCGFLLLLKLLVRIADVFKATSLQNHLCQRESSVTFHCRVVLKAGATVKVAANMTTTMKKD